MSEVLVIDLRSLSYTGTTWLNLLLGSHADAFTLGAPQRAYQARRRQLDPAELCRVHGEACSFWPPAFARNAFGHQNLYREIATAASVSVVVVNNPFVDPQGVADLADTDVTVATFAVVRDPRAVAWSYHQRHGVDPQVAAQWVLEHAYLAPVDDAPVLRYEDAARDPNGALQVVGATVGLEYPADAADYFRFEHHPVGGNPTPFAVIRRHLSATPGTDPIVEARYQQALDHPGSVAIVEGWRGFRAADLATVERIIEPIATRWGYR